MMANSYGDSLFPPNQLVDFFGKLAGPKRLELAPGDHVVVEGTGLVGLPNHVWDSAYRWFDRYLAGVRNGIDTEKPVVLRRLDSDVVEQYRDWAHVTSSTKRLYLGRASGFGATGAMSTTATTGSWTETITSGYDTTAGAGVALLTGAFTALTGIPPVDWLPSVNRNNGSVWESGTLPGGAAIRGMPKLHLGISAPQGKGTVVGYLYDVDFTDTGRLIADAPVTWLSPANSVDVSFPATAYDVPAGHRLALVVDTVDALYLGANQNHATISFTDGSYLDVPLK
jgi:predicted acyl esterase